MIRTAPQQPGVRMKFELNTHSRSCERLPLPICVCVSVSFSTSIYLCILLPLPFPVWAYFFVLLLWIWDTSIFIGWELTSSSLSVSSVLSETPIALTESPTVTMRMPKSCCPPRTRLRNIRDRSAVQIVTLEYRTTNIPPLSKSSRVCRQIFQLWVFACKMKVDNRYRKIPRQH